MRIAYQYDEYIWQAQTKRGHHRSTIPYAFVLVHSWQADAAVEKVAQASNFRQGTATRICRKVISATQVYVRN